MGLLTWLGLRRLHVWERPTPLDEILGSPLQSLVARLYRFILFLRGRPFHPPRDRPAIRVVCLSDTHDQMPSSVPDGDLLIHAGDLTQAGTAADIQRQLDWLAGLPHEHKVVVCGNHDSWFDPASRAAEDVASGAKLDLKSLHYLENSAAVLEFKSGRKLAVYGSPDIPTCGGSEFAFQYPSHLQPWKGRIPMETDVLITHTPPKYHLDLHLGCEGLLDEVWRVRPRLHVFGHLHWGHGRESVFFDDCQLAYESLMARPRRGPLYDLLPSAAWVDTAKVLFYGVNSVLWKWLMLGPGSNDGSLMVNAAMMYGNTGRLGNKVQVVEL